MDSLVVASPHLDDGILSAGQFMAGRPDTMLVTVFAGLPPEGTAATTFDVNSGFMGGRQAVCRRRDEDRRAASFLAASYRHLDFVDHQYRQTLGATAPVDDIAAALFDALDGAQEQTLLAPVGVEHPDHVLVSDAAVLCLLDANVDVVFYEELPGRVLWPDVTAARLATLTERLEPLRLALDLTFIGDGPMHQKARAVDEYVSQRWALNRRCLFVPERFHRVVSCV